MADRIGPINVLLLSFLMGAIAQMAVWPFCQTFGGIIAFSVINGFFSSMYVPHSLVDLIVLVQSV